MDELVSANPNRHSRDLQWIDSADQLDHVQEGQSDVELEEYIEGIADTVRIGLDQSISILTPWFFNNMPQIYYQTTPRAEKVRHLSAIITGHIFETKQTVELWDRDKKKVTFIGPGGDRKSVEDMVARLADIDIKVGSLYFSRDNLLFLATFQQVGYTPADLDNTYISEKIADTRRLLYASYPDEHTLVDRYLANTDHDLVTYATPKRLALIFKMFRHMLAQEGAYTFVDTSKGSSVLSVSLGLKGVKISEVLEQIFHLMDRFGFRILRTFVAQFEHGFPEPIDVLHFSVTHISEKNIDANHVLVIKLVKALRTLAWIDNDRYTEFSRRPHDLSVNATNLLRSIASWVYILLGKENPYYYSEYQIFKTMAGQMKIAKGLVDLFRMRFNPLTVQTDREEVYGQMRHRLIHEIEEIIDRVERKILLEGINFIDHVLKTNYFLPTKTGLAFRLSSDVLDPSYYPDKPFGIFFVTGRDYRFFQVRWRDVSRGGLRIVMPRSSVDYGYALSGLFDEVYGLSHAQHLKNKDIPEGGSKAVMVIRPSGAKSRAVKGAINAMLDLLVVDDETHEELTSKQLDYYGEQELIYLGPDENMTNDLIGWVSSQASRRGYHISKAFISSKVEEGINHKAYGVTSEGLHVFVDHALHHIGLNPKESRFTVKMTGGPDGDVAGNELRILYREYRENARVVAIADGGGAAFDPEGLDWSELLRLVEAGQAIHHFDSQKLSSNSAAFIIKADSRENIQKRNDLHFQAKADVFIPAGGRPYTVSEGNWRKFIDETGEATCRAIVEGANIFFTQKARDRLQASGILMIKDSSANKTGVICSSFEVIASLLLSADEFLAIKEVYIREVIDILRSKARDEAALLFAEYRRFGGEKTLVELSMEISREINEITDILLNRLEERKDTILDEPIFCDILRRYCPKVLHATYPDRIFSLPKSHMVAIVASYVASYIVYSEGLGWLGSLVGQDRFQAIMTYMNYDRITAELVQSIEGSNLQDKAKIRTILERSAARELTMEDLVG